MDATRPKVKKDKDTVQFWLPDPADLERLMNLLEICGYTDESMAREEAFQSGEADTVVEVTVRKREITMPQPWCDETKWLDDFREGVWQA